MGVGFLFYITDKGLRYLDRVTGSAYPLGEKGRKESLLLWLENYGGMTFDQLYDVVDRQRAQRNQGELGYAPEGLRPDYYKTLQGLVREGCVSVDLSAGN